MAEKNKKTKKLQWHPAFYAGIQIEFEEEAHKLTFENEHHLSTKPLQIDVLIIKKNSEEAINKNIGRIFRKYNLVEYKNPKDYISIDDYYKVYAYGYLYKSLEPRQNQVKVEELTLTFVSERYPKNMTTHLKKIHRYTIEKVEPGIFYIVGGIIPIQLIVTSELSKENNLWLKSLTDKLKGIDIIEDLSREYDKHRKSELYNSVMDIIIRANSKKFEEASGMCDALEELFEKKMGEKLQQKEEQLQERLEEQLQEKLEEKDEQMRKIIEEKDARLQELEEQVKMLKEQLA